MSETKAQGKSNSPTSENFLSLYTEGVEVPNLKADKLQPLKEGVAILTPKDIVLRCKTGRIKGYRNNRGTGKVVPSTINEIADNFLPHKIGIITISEDGTIVDSHNRIGGLCLRAQSGKMTENDWNAEIPVRVVTRVQFMDTYKGLGESVPHSIANHLGNPDLLLGSCIFGNDGLYSYLKKVGFKRDEINLINGGSVLTVIANIMTALHLKNSNSIPESIKGFESYADVYKIRHIMKDMAQGLKGEPIALVHPSDYIKIAEGCLYYAQFRKALRTMKEKDEGLPSIKRWANSNGLVGLIISDIVFHSKSGRTLTSIKPSTLAQRLLYRAEKVDAIMADILGSHNKNAESAVKKVIAMALKPIEIQ